MSTISKLDLTQDQIKTIDQVVKKDIAGNNFVDANLIKSKANLSDQQVNEVVKAMNSYNQLPTELKDGTINSVQATTATTTLKNVEKDEATPLEKVISFVSEFGNVKASAWCSSQYGGWVNWSGVYLRANDCTYRYIAGAGGVSQLIFLVGTAICLSSTAGMCGSLLPLFWTATNWLVWKITVDAMYLRCDWKTSRFYINWRGIQVDSYC